MKHLLLDMSGNKTKLLCNGTEISLSSNTEYCFADSSMKKQAIRFAQDHFESFGEETVVWFKTRSRGVKLASAFGKVEVPNVALQGKQFTFYNHAVWLGI